MRRRAGVARVLLGGLAIASSVGIAAFALPSVAGATPSVFTPRSDLVPANSIQPPQARLDSTSCPTTTACVAIGSYETSTSSFAFFVEDFAGTVPTSASELSPSSVSQPEPASISCSDATDCVAVGVIGNQSLQFTETAGTWSSGVQLSSNEVPAGVSCVHAVSFCIVVGTNVNDGFAVSETGGTWGTPVTIPPPASANVGARTTLSAVSCFSASACEAVGTLVDSGVNSVIAAAFSSGTWGSAASLSVLSNDAPILTGISCPSATACLAVGASNPYQSPRKTDPIHATLSGGTWSALQIDDGPTTTVGGVTYFPTAWFTSVSCADINDCVSDGKYFPVITFTSSGPLQGMEVGSPVTAAGNSALKARQLAAPGSGSVQPSNVPSGENSVSCNSPSTCLLVGVYTAGGGSYPSSTAGGPAPPSAPRNVTAKPSRHKVTVTWLAPLSNGGAQVTSYSFYEIVGSKTTSLGTLGSTHSTTAHAFTGLKTGVRYGFYLKANNAGGRGPSSSTVYAKAR